MNGCLYVSPGDRTTLERLVADGKTAQKIAARARIVLLSGSGLGMNAIRRAARVSKPTVWRWQTAYMAGGVERLLNDKGKGERAGKKPIGGDVRLAIVTKTAKEKPAHATHWSARMMAAAMGVGHTTVQRIWKEHGLKPHLTRTFKLSNDPKFAEKVVDVVGLYLNPPDKAVVLCVDEKSQIQALDRTQPGLPMKKGRAATMTHDYKRNGTTTLFAALDAKTGEVIGECLPKHRAKEFIRFLNKIDRVVAKPLSIHAICDNYSTHKTPKVKTWLARHPRFKLHFIPTSSSWLNLVERLFAEITRQKIRRGVFKSVGDLVAAIEAWIENRNAKPKPFKWTAQADTILEKNARARKNMEKVKAGTV
ncbi:MAG: transposase [Gammaproteobacteria bacterium]|nr:MAG: transposase [Gammaproteobacteria bacterium]